MRHETSGLTGEWRPGSPTVGAAIHAGKKIGHAHVDGLGSITGRARPLVESYPNHTDDVVKVTIRIIRILNVSTGIGKAVYFGPGDTVIGASPESIAAGRAEIECAVSVGIDRQTLSHATTWHVAAEFEGQVCALPGIALIA